MGYISIQVQGTLIISLWAFGTMFALFHALKAVGLLRVSAEEEIEGLDMVEHGMPAYPTGILAGGGTSPAAGLPSAFVSSSVSPVPAHEGA